MTDLSSFACPPIRYGGRTSSSTTSELNLLTLYIILQGHNFHWGRVGDGWGTGDGGAFLHFSPPQFYNWNVIQNEATVCFGTMRTPPSGRVGCLECLFNWIKININNINYAPPTSKIKVEPMLLCSLVAF
jgi:hypothetical protein